MAVTESDAFCQQFLGSWYRHGERAFLGIVVSPWWRNSVLASPRWNMSWHKWGKALGELWNTFKTNSQIRFHLNWSHHSESLLEGDATQLVSRPFKEGKWKSWFKMKRERVSHFCWEQNKDYYANAIQGGQMKVLVWNESRKSIALLLRTKKRLVCQCHSRGANERVGLKWNEKEYRTFVENKIKISMPMPFKEGK